MRVARLEYEVGHSGEAARSERSNPLDFCPWNSSRDVFAASVVGNALGWRTDLGDDDGLAATEIMSLLREAQAMQVAGDLRLSSNNADIDHTGGRDGAQQAPRSVVLLLDAVSGSARDIERLVSQLLSSASLPTPEMGAIITPVALRSWVDGTRWRTIIVADIERVAAALGVLALPAVLLAGAVDDTVEQVDAITRRQGPANHRRVSGALSSADLR